VLLTPAPCDPIAPITMKVLEAVGGVPIAVLPGRATVAALPERLRFDSGQTPPSRRQHRIGVCFDPAHGGTMRRLAGVCLTCVICGVIAGCGSTGSSTTTSTAAGSPSGVPDAAALTQARVAAAGCMRGQGIDIPDPTPGRSGILSLLRTLGSYPSVEVQAAEKACAAQIHQAFPNATSLTPAERSKRLQQADVFSSCMRSRGIPYPDPSTLLSNPSSYYQALGSVDLNSPAFKSAGVACRAVMLKDTGG